LDSSSADVKACVGV